LDRGRVLPRRKEAWFGACMRLSLAALLALLAPSASSNALAQLPSVPGFDVGIYAAVTDPVALSFDAASGALYVGRDDNGSGGGNGDAVRIHRIAAGGGSVAEYGNAAIDDPDAVFFDAAGVASEGAAGSVLVAGVNIGASQGQVVAIRPDESVEIIDGPTTGYDNPTAFAVDGTGRVLMSDLRTSGSGQVLVVTGVGAPTPLITIAGAGALFLAVDPQNRIYVSKTDGSIARYDAAGALLDASFGTGLGGGPAIAVAPGGGFGTALYALDRMAGSLVRVDGASMQTTVGTGFQDVRGMTFGPDGALYVSEFGNDRVLRIEPAFPTTSSTVVTTTSITTTTIVTTTTTTTTTSSTSTTSTTSTVSTTTIVTSTTSTTIFGAVHLLPARKLLVRQKKSGTQRLQMLAKDPGVSVAQPCESNGELLVQAAGAPMRSFPLDAALWKPIKAKKPERGCKYRKGPVVATVQIKTGKALKIVANAEDLGVALDTDPRPVRIELRHGAERHCFEFGGQGKHKADKKLLAKNAAAPAGCPAP